MKGLMLVLALLLMASVAQAGTQTAKMDVYDGHSFIGPPIVPIDPDPFNLFIGSGIDVDAEAILKRYDAPTSSWITWFMGAGPGQGTFNILLGEGYWVDTGPFPPPSNPTQVVYTGIQDGVPDAGGTMTDMWISLPGDQLDGQNAGGHHFISCPFNHKVSFNTDWSSSDPGMDGLNIKFTDGNVVKSWFDACYGSPAWVQWPMKWYDASVTSWKTAGEELVDETYLNPGRSYWVVTYRDNLAMIVPAYPIYTGP